jgi:hypothetical protein
MWALGQKAEKASKLPSECIPGLANEVCDWTIYQFDNAVPYFMTVISNALLEREKTPSGARWGHPPLGADDKSYDTQAKYTLSQLLDVKFRLPRPPSERERRRQVGGALKAMLGGNSRQKPKAQGKPKLPLSLAVQLEARGIRL